MMGLFKKEITVLERPPSNSLQVYVDQAYEQFVRWNKALDSYARKGADNHKVQIATRNLEFYRALVQLLEDFKERND